jgi:pimeloyl-ACP methyl ester carboxylesterase
MRRRHLVRGGIALAAAAGVTASVMTLPALAAEEEPSAIDWGACPEDVTATGLECAAVAVPLDYDEPDGETVDVMISRIASQDPDRRRGVLMLNPGGPGGAGLSQPADLIGLGLPTTVADAYDLVGMDPRGVGHSSPVSCGFTDDQAYPGNIPPYAEDEAAVDEWAAQAKAVADQCAAADPDGLMAHMTTANTARDMDFIRESLGEERLSFYGASYGSVLGAAYASLFPDRSDRIVIDSNAGGASMGYGFQRRWGSGMEEAFPDFAEWAAERHKSYGLGATPEAVRDHYFALAERLDEQPVAGVDGAAFRFYVFFTLYAESLYARGAQTWQALAESDEDTVRALLDRHQSAAPAASPGDVSPHDNAWSSYLAVTCNDTDWPEGVDFYREAVAADRETYPMFGAAAANASPCAFWHHDPLEPPVAIEDDGPQNVLILQNLRDVATPYAAAELNREAFGDRARLVSVDEGGHGVYVYDDNPCALNVTTSFLVDGEMPEDDVTCSGAMASGLDLDTAAEERRADALERLGR